MERLTEQKKNSDIQNLTKHKLQNKTNNKQQHYTNRNMNIEDGKLTLK